MSTEADLRGLGAALAAIVSTDLDVADVLAQLLIDCLVSSGAAAAALLAIEADGDLALLSATSHSIGDLEMLQAQRVAGPCVECIATGEPVTATSSEELVRRWDDVGSALVDAGFERVQAYPMRWRDAALGGLNLFWGTSGSGTSSLADPSTLQAYADVASLVLMGSNVVSIADVQASLHDALASREVIEQAKGVLAQALEVPLEAAYRTLLERSVVTGVSLSTVAGIVIGSRGRG